MRRRTYENVSKINKGEIMALTINITYKGDGDSARKFAEEMLSSGIVDEIRREDGNLRYDYYLPLKEDGTILLVDVWEDQEALDRHHLSPVMGKILSLREKHNLTMTVQRFTDNSPIPDKDKQYIK